MKKIAIVWAVAFATLLPAAEGQEAQEILDACDAPEVVLGKSREQVYPIRYKSEVGIPGVNPGGVVDGVVIGDVSR